MTSTANYSAGIETNNTQITYVAEGTYAATTPPSSGWGAIRYISENLTGTKNRSRPGEINNAREAIQGVTVSEAAAGTINGALSYSTFDQFFATAMNNVWTVTTITGSSGNIALAVSGSITLTISSTTWVGITAGMWIRLTGFSNAVNNNIYRITSMTSTVLTLAAPFCTPVAETPAGSAAVVNAHQIMNSNVFTSLYIQKQLQSGSAYLVYPGAYVTGFTVQGQVGQFVQANFPVIASQEMSANAAQTGSTGLTAPTGTVNNTVKNFLGITWNDVLINATCDSFAITVANNGAAAEYGLGSSTSAGVLAGTFEVNGQLGMYFKDFTYYSLFKAETSGRLSIATRDAAGNAYVFTFLNCVLLNPQIVAGGPGQSVMAKFTIEGSPQSGGGTLTIDKL